MQGLKNVIPLIAVMATGAMANQMATMQDKAAFVSKLAASLEAADPVVRMRAAMGLLDLGQDAQGAVEQLIKAAQTSDQGTKVVAITALGTAGGERSAAFLGQLVAGENDATERAAAARALAVMKAEGQVPALQKALQSRDRLVRAQAMEAIATIGGTVATGIATQSMASGDQILRVHAASLMLGKDPKASTILAGATRSKDPVVRSTALSVIAARATDPAVKSANLLAGLPALSTEEQIAVSYIRAAQGDAKSADALMRMLSGSGQSALQAGTALGRLFSTPAGMNARSELVRRLSAATGVMSSTEITPLMADYNGIEVVEVATVGRVNTTYEPLMGRLETTLKSSTDVGARTVTARVLGFMKTDRARAILNAALATEKDMGVRLTIETALVRS